MSVYAAYSNATIVFKRTAAYISGYSDDLNPEPLDEEVEVRAYIRKSRQPFVVQTPGQQPPSNYVGNITEPIPEGVRLPGRVTVKFDTGGEAQFNCLPELPSPFYNEVSTLGQPIRLE